MMNKHARWRQKNRDLGLCPHCGKLPAPGFKQCDYRIKFKALNRILNVACRDGVIVKVARGLFGSKEAT